MLISIGTFKGVRPKIAPDLLPPGYAQTAENAKLTNGQLRPWDQQLAVYDAVNTGTIRTIVLFQDSYWLEWEADVDFVPGPISADTTGRSYYTGHGIPKKTNTALAVTGSGALPVAYYPMGVPGPVEIPSAVLTTDQGVGDPRAINYVWTIVTNWGEEGVPSLASDNLICKNGDKVTISGMTLQWKAGQSYAVGDTVLATTGFLVQEDGESLVELEGGDGFITLEGESTRDSATTWMFRCVAAGVSGTVEPSWNNSIDGDTSDGTVTWRTFPCNIANKRIYRIAVGKENAQYEYLNQIAVEETTYVDTTTDAYLGEVLASEDYDQPPDAMLGLVFMSNGILAGFSGKDVFFCDAYRPWSWPIAYSLALGSTIIGLESLGGALVATTAERPFVITGTDPSSMTPIRLPDPHACVSKRGIVAYGNGVMYPSSDGLYMITGNQMVNMTKDHFTVDEWQAIHPETLHSYIWDSKYVGFYSSGGDEGAIILDLVNGDLTTLGIYCDAAYVDPETDNLYLCRSYSDRVLLEDGEGFLEMEDGIGEIELEH